MASLVCKLFNMKIYLTKDLQYNILITLSNNDFTHTLYDSFTTHDLEFTQTELHVHVHHALIMYIVRQSCSYGNGHSHC